MGNILLNRKDVDQSLTWDLSAIYGTEEEYKLAVEELKNFSIEIEREYKGRLSDEDNINNCLDKIRVLSLNLYLTSSYRRLSLAVDNTNNENQERFMKFMNIESEIDSRLSFVEVNLYNVMKML